MGPTWSLWEAKCPRVIPSAPGPPIRAWNLVGWGVRLPQQGWRVIRAYWRGRSRLTGEPLGVKAGRVGGTPDDGRSVGRRNLSCTGKPRGLREISGRTRGGDQANRLNRSGSHTGYLMPGGVVEGHHPINEGRKPGPAPWGLPPSGPASAPTGGRAWPRALPRQREGGLPGRGVSASAGRGAPKEGRGPKGSTGEGTPRRDPGGPAGRSRPNGRVGGHQTATATAATAYLWRRGPAYRTSHGRPQAQMGRGARGDPRDGPGETGAEPHGLLREESGAAAKGARGPSGR